MQGLDLLKPGKTYSVSVWKHGKLVIWENVKFLSIYKGIALFNTNYKTTGGALVLHVNIADSRNAVKLPEKKFVNR